MPRKGVSWLDTVDQGLFGPNPRSGAECNQSAAPGTGPRSQVQRGRWRQPIQRASKEEFQHVARQRVLQFEAALASFVDSKGAEVTICKNH